MGGARIFMGCRAGSQRAGNASPIVASLADEVIEAITRMEDTIYYRQREIDKETDGF